MTQVHADNGMVVPATVIEAGPCVISQVKTKEKDGYYAVQCSFGQKKKANKPQKKHCEGLSGIMSGRAAAFAKEIRVESIPDGAERGDCITVDSFIVGDRVRVTGWSKGRGFAGVVKRHHFHGHPTTHGHKDQTRMPGSIGSGGVQHVFRGKRMAGRMGNEQVTVHGLDIVAVIPEHNQLLVKGAIPGSMNSFVVIVADNGDMIFKKSITKEEPKEDTASTIEYIVPADIGAQGVKAKTPSEETI